MSDSKTPIKRGDPGAGVLRWVHSPQQERTRQSLSRILDAAEALLEEKSFDEVSISEIAAKAESSVGGFYRRFPDKSGLLHALHERFVEEARATADDALDPSRWETASVGEIIEAVTAFLVEISRERQGLFLAFLQRGVSEETVRERTDALFAYLCDGLGTLLKDRSAEIRHPEPALAAAFGLHVVLGTINQMLLLRPTPLDVSESRLVSELAHVFTSYLGATGPYLPPSDAEKVTE